MAEFIVSFSPGSKTLVVIAHSTRQPRMTTLTDLPQAVRDKLKAGAKLSCVGDEMGAPSSLRLMGGQAPTQSRRSNAPAPELYKVEAVRQTSVVFDKNFGQPPGQNTTNHESLSLSDQVLGAQKDAKYQPDGKRWQLATYSPRVTPGLKGSTPDIDDNPYNFVPSEQAPLVADEPLKAQHDRDQDGRHSGVINLTYVARTPIFVPKSVTAETQAPANQETTREFFRCLDAEGLEKYAIPGASMKGPVRSLFEAVTNSRMGVTDEKALKYPPLYRRRAFRLFKVISVPTAAANGQVQECDYEFLAAGNPTDPTVLDYRANTYWVGSERHSHATKKAIKYRLVPGALFTLGFTVHERWQSMFENGGHPHMRGHYDTVTKMKERSFYVDPLAIGAASRFAPPYEAAINAGLSTLQTNDLIFAIPGTGTKASEIICFGRNVNFLWPGAQSPFAMLKAAGIHTRPEASVRLDDADMAEATFGFAGRNRSVSKPLRPGDPRPESHPFQGRVRLATFWGPAVSETGRVVELKPMPLTAPSGTKAKSRPLYLRPGQDGTAVDWDSNARLRGRKFYWHQRAEGDGLSLQHDARQLPLSPGPPPQWNVGQNELLKALRRDTEFKGQVHFDNLTSAELGALLVCLAPHLVFQQAAKAEMEADDVDFGLKVGKGKPRGLGSLVATKVNLIVQLPLVKDRYDQFTTWTLEGAQWGSPRDPGAFISAFWTADRKNGSAGRAIRNLCRIPTATSVRVYPPRFNMYGWLPEESKANQRGGANAEVAQRAADGGPKGGDRRVALRPAEDL